MCFLQFPTTCVRKISQIEKHVVVHHFSHKIHHPHPFVPSLFVKQRKLIRVPINELESTDTDRFPKIVPASRRLKQLKRPTSVAIETPTFFAVENLKIEKDDVLKPY